ncbi:MULTISPECIES: aldo/keto reductase [unclassified Rathayibacter]|uniref:aldo/keto reductase n=1 Tax=unclassified Rathayibacter TaxID=2609250 RepID=UPI001889D284|nr:MULTISPECIES: aldo/keto reductase [unclassified Rathayibacter]MBF4463218.1 aldo/keto reductase [Rathayibacter sp. VKM Ac-2879]MBF4504545.1 aldo/keto reductase [Rathayibacter sp. VKM Ac-2878]
MTSQTSALRPFGPSGAAVTRLTLGTSWRPERVGGLDRVPALERVLDSTTGDRPVSVIDTSNEYAGGTSERLIGDALRARGGVPEGITVVTKLDRDPTTGSYSAERMRRSLDESRERLGMDVLPLLYLHDPERISYDEAFEEDGPVRALVAMKEAGVALSIGISGGPAPMLRHYVNTGLFDAVITHNRFTLVDRSSEELIDASVARGMVVVNAAVYGGGALARWPEPVTSYAYAPAAAAIVDAVAAMGAACQRAGVPLAAAALQFSTRDPRVTTTVVGATSAEHYDAFVADDALELPDALVEELESLVPPSSVWQDAPGTGWPR